MSNARRIQRIRANLAGALTDLHNVETFISDQMNLSDMLRPRDFVG